MSIYTWKEDENILCPNCKTELDSTDKYIFCSKCGLLFDKHWIIETAKKLTLPDNEEVQKFAEDLCDKLKEGLND